MLDAVIVDASSSLPIMPESLPLASPPVVRLFDSAAEEELLPQFGTALTQRFATRAKYANTRWQVQGTAAAREGRKIVVSAPSREHCIVEMRDEAEIAKVKANEPNWVEGSIEECGPLGRLLVDAVVIAGPSPLPTKSTSPLPPSMVRSPAVDHRSKWHYINAPLLFPNQTVTEGTFNKVGDVWLEDRVGDKPQDFKEVGRTADYVEIARPVGDFRIRLYAGRSEYKFGNEGVWKEMFPGDWE